jgi:hypothetical protein
MRPRRTPQLTRSRRRNRRELGSGALRIREHEHGCDDHQCGDRSQSESDRAQASLISHGTSRSKGRRPASCLAASLHEQIRDAADGDDRGLGPRNDDGHGCFPLDGSSCWATWLSNAVRGRTFRRTAFAAAKNPVPEQRVMISFRKVLMSIVTVFCASLHASEADTASDLPADCVEEWR